jgi:hypothetical protein
MYENKNKEDWNYWFAGLTDGDGCFYINKKEKSISFEITTHIIDARVLQIVKRQLQGGSVKPRSHCQGIRYRVKKITIILDIINRLNGKLHNTIRIEQLKQTCQMLSIEFINTAPKLNKNAPYIAGLLDSDGCFSISTCFATDKDSQESGVSGKITQLTNSKAYNQICGSITSVDLHVIEFLNSSYGFGVIYEEPPAKKNPTWKTKYHWTIRSEEEFVILYNLLKKYPLRSVKMHRVRLSMLYFRYKKLKYHLKSPATIEFKIWEKFCKSWFKYS